MNYKDFEEVINRMISQSNKLHAASALKIDLSEAFEDYEVALHFLWKQVLTEEGYDWLSWYLYDKDGISGNPRKHLQAWDHDEKEICQDLKALWEYLKKYNYFRINQNK